MPLYWVTHASAVASPATATFDAIELVVATGIIRVQRVYLYQTSDLGDAAEEVVRTEWIRGHTTSGSGGQTTVITPLNPFDAAATFTAETINTTIASAGTGLSLAPMGWNVRIPFDMIYPPGAEIVARATTAQDRIVFRISGQADALTLNAACLVEQL